MVRFAPEIDRADRRTGRVTVEDDRHLRKKESLNRRINRVIALSERLNQERDCPSSMGSCSVSEGRAALMQRIEGQTARLRDLVEYWTEQAKGAAEARPKVPLAVLLGEASELASFVERRWQPTSTSGEPWAQSSRPRSDVDSASERPAEPSEELGAPALPGLSVVERAGRISLDTAREMRELVTAVTAISVQCVEPAAPSPDLEKRARRLLSEVKEVLDYALGAEAEAHLGGLRQETRNTTTHDQLTLAMTLWAHTALQFQEELRVLGDYDSSLPSRLIEMAEELGAQDVDFNKPLWERRRKRSLRRQLITLLCDRMREVRRAVRYVFRDHPHLVRQATSDYQRERRKQRRVRRAVKRASA